MAIQIGPPVGTYTPNTSTFVEGVAGSFDNVEINHGHADALIGQLLTLVDATFTDREQRRAHKTLVKRTVREWLDDQYSLKAGFGRMESSSDNS